MSEVITRTITGAILVSIVIGATMYSFATSALLWALIATLGIMELRKNSMGGKMGFIYLISSASSVVGLGFFSFSNDMFYMTLDSYQGVNGAVFLCVIWTNDTFAYLGGMALGKKFIPKGLSPSISPNKSWEGAIVGVAIASIVSYLILGNQGILLGLCIGILATISDLFESKAKRKAGIKDTGSLLPGHGGILDRFDALLLSAPFTLIVFYIISQ